ncbi:recombination mediator RecR [Rickettsiales bacterium LUAb2]
MEHNKVIDKVISAFSRLPGVGQRSATRMVFYLMQKKDPILIPLVEQLQSLATEIKICDTCNNIDTCNPCSICSNLKRNHQQICIIEDISSLWALEKSRVYSGTYFVLNGTLSAVNNQTPEYLKIPNLLNLINNNNVEEVILATSLTIEGQTTAYYIKDQIIASNTNINITTLAQGVPAGGEIEYLDELTLGTALKLRKGL